MLEEKQRQFWNLRGIRYKVTENDFQFSGLNFFIAGQRSKKTYFWKYKKKEH